MTKSKWIRVSTLVVAGATLLAWGCTYSGWWYPVTLIGTALISYTVGGLAAPNA